MCVVSPTLLVTVTVTSTCPPTGIDPPAGATVTRPGMAATRRVQFETGPFAAVSTKDPLAGVPLFEVSISLPGATSRYPCAGKLDGEGDGDGDVPDDDVPGAGVPGPVDDPALVAPASAACDVG